MVNTFVTSDSVENRRLKEYIKKIGHDPDKALSDINETS